MSTPFGPVVLVWANAGGRPGIIRVVLSRPDAPAGRQTRTLFPDAARGSCSKIDAVAAQMAAFLDGENIRFSLGAVRMDLCTGFQRRVLEAEHRIPRGRVSTYGRIAARLGHSRGARAVGTALARNPFPIIVPCHRAIRSDFALGGFQSGVEMKRALLRMEGNAITPAGRIAHPRLFY